MMKLSLAPLAVLLLASAPALAGADAWPGVATAAHPAFASLPEGHFPEVPVQPRPASVPASSHVPGFFVVPPREDQGKRFREMGRGEAILVGSAERARAFAEGRPEPDDGKGMCFTEGPSPQRVDEDEDDGLPPPPLDWPARAESLVALQFQSGGGPDASAVHAIRGEHLVLDAQSDGQTASLEVTEAWVDARTRGARVLQRATLRFERVYAGPNHADVYAAREGETIHVVMRSPTSPIDEKTAIVQFEAGSRSFAVAMPGGAVEASDCGHMHLVLRAAPGTAQMATLQSIAFLPPLEGDEAVVEAQDQAFPERIAALKLFALRRRPYQVSVSASATSADPHPVVTIAAEWLGRERRNGG